MKAVIQQTSKQLNSSFRIGYVVIPNNLRDYRPIMDEFMHIFFGFCRYSQPDDDLIEYDIITVAEGAQYGYALVETYDYWLSQKPEYPHYAEDDYFVYVNAEDDFVEAGYGCIRDPSCIPYYTRLILSDPEQENRTSIHQEQGAMLMSDQGIWRLWPGEPEISLAGIEIMHDIARRISSFLKEIPFIEDVGELRAVVLISGGSPSLLEVSKTALSYALPHVDPAIFLTSLEPRYVPSLGAALMIRNRIAKQRQNRT
ncbi:hypothetical protein GGS24DRAFT_32488 [Hypoxylon argillaceum]|nr:hypothetical protein GGS24DRAFT_32488 [Hypoxylon argillaceum]